MADPDENSNGPNNFACATISVAPPVNLIAALLEISQPGYPDRGLCSNPPVPGSACEIYIGRPVDIEAAITQSGDVEITDVEAILFGQNNDFEPAYTRNRLEIEPDQLLTLEFPEWMPEHIDEFDMLFIVDPYNAIDEGSGNEDDNERVIPVDVRMPEKPDLSKMPGGFFETTDSIAYFNDETVSVSGHFINQDLAGIAIDDPFQVSTYYSSIPPDHPNLLEDVIFADHDDKHIVSQTVVDESIPAGGTFEVGNIAWDLSDVEPGIHYLYMVADSVYPGGDHFYGEIDEVWEGMDNVLVRQVVIAPNDEHVQDARRTGIQWLLDHQHTVEFGEPGTIEARY